MAEPAKKSIQFTEQSFPPGEARTNHLLVIGINAYVHHPRLYNARRDAETFRDVMLEQFQFEPATLVELYDAQATRRQIIQALHRLEETLTKQDNLLIYFSGHGVMNRRKTQGFWVPVDAEAHQADYLANTRIRDILGDMEAHHIYLIVDACFAGSMVVRSTAGHTDLLEQNPSRRVLSSGRQEVVSDGRPGEHSPFFDCVKHQLTQVMGDALTAKRLELYVSENTPRSADQQPIADFIYGIGDQSGQFVFYPKRNMEAAYEAALSAETLTALDQFEAAYPTHPYEDDIAPQRLKLQDQAAWEDAQQADTLVAYRQYRRGFPVGQYRQEALSRISAKEVQQAWAKATRQDTVSAYERFIDRFPNSDQAQAADQRIERLLEDLRSPTPSPLPQQPRPKRSKPQVPSFDFPVPKMVHVEGGTFQMGSKEYAVEQPIHQVAISSFELGMYPVTQREWVAIMEDNPSYFKGDELPVERVSWEDCQAFLARLNQRTGLHFRLPTEAEWEYAAGGGATARTKWAGTNDEATLKQYAWYQANSEGSTHAVGQRKPNRLGLHDMSGHVWEWCSDWYGAEYYTEFKHKLAQNPTGPGKGDSRVLRGGSWNLNSIHCRVANRNRNYPFSRYNDNGFRIARDLP